MARNEKIQAPRPRFSGQISRLHKMSRMRRRTTTKRSARVKSRRAIAARNRRAVDQKRAEIFRRIKTKRRTRTNRRQISSGNSPANKISGRCRFGLFDAKSSCFDLSGGEAQRIQLATNLGSLLVGALYVLDEPSIGLHPRDNSRLIKILENLRDIGNTVLVVEHDEETMRSADHILDIGLHAGELGGNLVFEGDFEGLIEDEISLTAKYLRGDTEIKTPAETRKAGKKKIEIIGAREHNLKNVIVEIPLDMLVCVTGVSGSGKSTLVHDILYAGIKKKRGEWKAQVGHFKEIKGAEFIDDVILVDQSPIGRTPRSNPVTYIKAYDAIREVFAANQRVKNKRL